MSDASIYVAVISASAAILGAAVSAVNIAYQNARQAERGRQQRREEEVRTACLDLLRAAVDLRTQVENNKEYQGPKMRSRLSRVRKHASDAELHAVLIGTIEPSVFADLADKLAKAVRNVALAAGNANLEMNMPTELLDLGELNDCIEAFCRRAIAYAKGATQLSVGIVGQLPRDLTVLG